MAAKQKIPRPDWPACAARLAELLPLARLDPSALAVAGRRSSSSPWCVGFSGGADSLALLLLLWAHWPERRGKLVALHFNHRLRGKAADADAAFCEKVCRSLGIRCRIGTWQRARGAGRVSEASARQARHAFFVTEMRRAKARTLWVAHHLDDVAETLLMRIARGSGTAGLAAPRPVQAMPEGRAHVRLLLTLKKADIMAALQRAGAQWREDETNAGSDYFRNRVRLRVLPALAEAAGRDVLAGAGLSRARLEEDDSALEAWVDQLAPITRRLLDWNAVAEAPRAVRRRALHRWLVLAAPQTDLSRQGFELLLGALERGRDTRFSLGPHSFAKLKSGKATVVKR